MNWFKRETWFAIQCDGCKRDVMDSVPTYRNGNRVVLCRECFRDWIAK